MGERVVMLMGKKAWSLMGTTALVTGGTKGIGHAIVEELVGFGSNVHTCTNSEVELKNCLQEWEKLKFNVTGSVCDVSSRVEREKLMKKVSSMFNGKLNILINNAATTLLKPIVDFTAEDYSLLMTTNLESAFHLSQLAHPMLKASGMGSVINISSVAGVRAIEGHCLYAAAKGAINQLTTNFAFEWAKDNIRTNGIAPGPTRTSMAVPFLNDKDAMAKEVSRNPIGRIAEPGDIASLAAFLCMPSASFITGQLIYVDGGRTIKD